MTATASVAVAAVAVGASGGMVGGIGSSFIILLLVFVAEFAR